MRSQSQVILALDTSTRNVGIALHNGFRVLYESSWTSQDYHTAELAPAIYDALQKAKIEIDEIGAISIAIGPGSFTGLRVGLALAKGLAIIRHLPLISVPTLDIYAAAQPPLTIPLVAVLRAGRGKYAVSWFQMMNGCWEQNEKIELLTLIELAERILVPTLVCGELTEEERIFLKHKHSFAQLASPAQCVRRPAVLAEIGWNLWQEKKLADPITLTPIYLHLNEPIPG